MRKVAFSAFRRELKKEFIWKKDSRVAVLLEHSGYWQRISESFLRELVITCEVVYLEADSQEEAIWQKQLEKVRRWKIDGIIGIGSYEILQKACWLRNTFLEETVPILLFSGRDCWQMLEKDTLWIRNREGDTLYWGYQKENETDLLVFPDEVLHKKKSENGQIGLEILGGAIEKWKNGIEYLLTEENTLELDEKKRMLLEELAEPMRIRYGIPMEIGLYYGIIYLYRILSEEHKQKLCIRCKVKITEGIWQLEKIAHQVCAKELAGVVLSERDVFLLTKMAMEGIENLPLGQQLSWQQVELFYRELA